MGLLAENRNTDVQWCVAFKLGNLALDVKYRIKIGQSSDVIKRLVALFVGDVGENVKPWSAFALGNLALDVENKIKMSLEDLWRSWQRM